MRAKNLRAGVVVALLAAAACGGDSGNRVAPPPDARPVDQSKAGVLSGRVLHEGPLPAGGPIGMTSDPFCARANPSGAAGESLVGENGGLGNVFVYIKDGLGSYWVDVPNEPARLDQHGCRYVPHVLGIRAGQTLQIGNSDETMHNVHALARVNGEFNFSQPIKGQITEKVFSAQEVMVTFKCDVHSWMSAYVGVVNHPYFAVTAPDGRFAVKGVPAGTYTIEAWHETLGTQAQSVALGEKESKEVAFTFR